MSLFFRTRSFVSLLLVLGLLLNSLTSNSALAANGPSGEPATTAEIQARPAPVAPRLVRIADYTSAKIKSAREFCAAKLEKAPAPIRMAARGLGWATLVIPSVRTLSDSAKFYNIMFERPLMGLISTPAGVGVNYLLATLVGGSADPWRDGSGDGWNWGMFLRRTVENWWSFNSSNITRGSVALMTDKSPLVRFMLDYYGSAATYILGTAGYDLMRASSTGSSEIMTLAMAKVAFALQWPIISRPIGQWLTIYLFSSFPDVKILDQILRPGFDLDGFVAKKNQERDAINVQIPALHDDVVKTRAEFLWPTEGSRLNALNRYFAARERYRVMRSKAKGIEAQVKWAQKLRHGLTADQAVPRGRFLAYRAYKQVAETTVAISLLSLYFTLRDWSVGETYDPSRPNQSLVQHLFGDVAFNEALEQVDAGALIDGDSAKLADTIEHLQPHMDSQMADSEFSDLVHSQVEEMSAESFENITTTVTVSE
jgi:hypothetical protein